MGLGIWVINNSSEGWKQYCLSYTFSLVRIYVQLPPHAKLENQKHDEYKGHDQKLMCTNQLISLTQKASCILALPQREFHHIVEELSSISAGSLEMFPFAFEQ